MSWIDITVELSENVAEWPGDTPFSFETPVTKEMSGSVNIGKITTSTHIGTHVDAPFHFDNDGATIEALDINRYIGNATIIEVVGKEEISKSDLEAHNIEGTILLIKTHAATDKSAFPNEVPTLTLDAVTYLAEQGIKLFGIDVPSVDLVNSKTLDVHHALHAHDIMIIENIVLDRVDSGLYDFIALPLKIKGADGSPVRAVVRKKEEDHES
ncbi:arylformamidase [Aliicoccus persicus]|uniref:Kynurenine formamidase n=1 Tax=Aliicoccus persicus TaxID=930138 RepID=A0A662Z7M4_9STAP|nr:arylformamidase [Aliicoccus persicus]SEW15874.1 Kynurenine formamidase [Aliicoccus persicus]